MIRRYIEKYIFRIKFTWIFMLIFSLGSFAAAYISHRDYLPGVKFWLILGIFFMVLTIISLKAHITYVKNYIALNGTERITNTIKLAVIWLAASAVIIVLVFAIATVVNKF